MSTNFIIFFILFYRNLSDLRAEGTVIEPQTETSFSSLSSVPPGQCWDSTALVLPTAIPVHHTQSVLCHRQRPNRFSAICKIHQPQYLHSKPYDSDCCLLGGNAGCIVNGYEVSAEEIMLPSSGRSSSILLQNVCNQLQGYKASQLRKPQYDPISVKTSVLVVLQCSFLDKLCQRKLRSQTLSAYWAVLQFFSLPNVIIFITQAMNTLRLSRKKNVNYCKVFEIKYSRKSTEVQAAASCRMSEQSSPNCMLQGQRKIVQQ
jgi:hypothetical protein